MVMLRSIVPRFHDVNCLNSVLVLCSLSSTLCPLFFVLCIVSSVFCLLYSVLSPFSSVLVPRYPQHCPLPPLSSVVSDLTENILKKFCVIVLAASQLRRANCQSSNLKRNSRGLRSKLQDLWNGGFPILESVLPPMTQAIVRCRSWD